MCVVVSNGIPEIASEVRQTPDIIINSLGLAFHQVLNQYPICYAILLIWMLIAMEGFSTVC